MIAVARYGIGILSVVQGSFLGLVIYLSIGMSSETLYNLDDLELASFKSTSVYTGLIFISIALFCSVLGLALASINRICC